MSECGCKPYEPCPTHEESSENEAAALRAEVERLTQERDDWMARAHTYDVERQQYHAERDAAQARLAALIAKVELWVDADGEVREALAAAQSGDGRKEDGDGEV